MSRTSSRSLDSLPNWIERGLTRLVLFYLKVINMKRRAILKCMGSSLVLFGSNVNFAQVVGLSDAINRAGCQRMLSQRAVKAYLAVGQGVFPDKTHEILWESIALFDRQLIELKGFAPNAEVRATYGELGSAWATFKAQLVEKTPNREKVPALIELDAHVLALANQGTMQLEQISGRPAGRLVNVAGRQRMLSQRVAKFYLAQAWRLAIPNAQAELDRARNEFVSALDVLTNAPEATASIKQELELARNQWVFYEAALAAGGTDGAVPEQRANVFQSSENILWVMDKVTGLYARLAA